MKEGRQMKLKASIPVVQANSNALYDFRHFAAFPADTVHLKKPSRWPKALIGSPCHGEEVNVWSKII
jgi:hypothetical protein